MWYWWAGAIAALCVILDGWRRGLRAVTFGWAMAMFLFVPLALPVYFAVRPLYEGETREGGTAWNVLKNFALCWTLLMAIVAVAAVMSLGQASSSQQSDAQRVGYAIGSALGLGLLAAAWFFPMIGAIILGFFLKKSSFVESGPTGPLASAAMTDPTRPTSDEGVASPEISAAEPWGAASSPASAAPDPTDRLEPVGEDQQVQYYLTVLRDGAPHQKTRAREKLAAIFERRGMLEEAAELYEMNIQHGTAEADVYERLATVYRRMGREPLAQAAEVEARKLRQRAP
jgi:hypothetical protein